MLFYFEYSSGFAIENEDDQTVKDESGLQRKLHCGTEKSKHKSKNHRTAGEPANVNRQNYL